METHSRTRKVSRGSLAVAMVLLLGTGLAVAQSADKNQAPTPPAPATQGRMAPMMNGGQGRGMMAERQQMMADMKAMDQKLDDLVAKMTAAKGTERIDAIAAVVKELAAQHTQMRGRMMTMHEGMMKQMMQAPAKEGSDADHSSHHQ
jgi:hypothetical protein